MTEDERIFYFLLDRCDDGRPLTEFGFWWAVYAELVFTWPR